MTFEDDFKKKFPGLINRYFSATDKDGFENNIIPYAYHINAVEECCLDKQRVKETIKKRLNQISFISKSDYSKGYYDGIMKLGKTLLKDLGME